MSSLASFSRTASRIHFEKFSSRSSLFSLWRRSMIASMRSFSSGSIAKLTIFFAIG